jgi:hypothetical protein
MFQLTIRTGNGSFFNDDDDPASVNHEARGAEVARILREIAGHVENGAVDGPAYDSAGNQVGSFTYVR